MSHKGNAALTSSCPVGNVSHSGVIKSLLQAKRDQGNAAVVEAARAALTTKLSVNSTRKGAEQLWSTGNDYNDVLPEAKIDS